MNPININELPLHPTPLGGQSRMLADRPDLRLVNLLLQPGEIVKSHTAPIEVVFIIQEGSGRLTADGKAVDVTAGQMLSCPPDIAREVQAGAEGLNLLVIRVPNL
ncbi:MAG: cupin domain-containing protein [Candidatus Saccharibacteria bacterium]